MIKINIRSLTRSCGPDAAQRCVDAAIDAKNARIKELEAALAKANRIILAAHHNHYGDGFDGMPVECPGVNIKESE